MRALFLATALSFSSSYARIHSLPEDTHAFPKFSVSFLNGHPLLNETAERWLTQGLRGGQQEFLDQPWSPGGHNSPTSRKGIGSGDTSSDTPPTPIPSDPTSYVATNYTLQRMRMGPQNSYLCFIPKPSDAASHRTQEEQVDDDQTPARTWSLLQPLSGTCLYHRQGWFTYSYCHNKDIRQFKELAQPQARLPAGTYSPEEDPEWESYTLGRAPRSSEEPGVDLTVAERNAEATNLELAKNAGSRYLVQRWGDGTICDKTGKPREIEVQFHCSMVMTDHILFVKETKTCSYVLVIHTPRLCGEPGFRSTRDASEEALIRCREIVRELPPAVSNAVAQAHWPLPSGDTPVKESKRKAVPQSIDISASGAAAAVEAAPKAKVPLYGSGSRWVKMGSAAGKGSVKKTQEEGVYEDLINKALDALNQDTRFDGAGRDAKAVMAEIDGDGQLVIEYEDYGDDLPADNMQATANRIMEALRAAGYDVQRTEIPKQRGKKDKEKKKGKKESSKRNSNSWFGGRFEL